MLTSLHVPNEFYAIFLKIAKRVPSREVARGPRFLRDFERGPSKDQMAGSTFFQLNVGPKLWPDEGRSAKREKKIFFVVRQPTVFGGPTQAPITPNWLGDGMACWYSK